MPARFGHPVFRLEVTRLILIFLSFFFFLPHASLRANDVLLAIFLIPPTRSGVLVIDGLIVCLAFSPACVGFLFPCREL